MATAIAVLALLGCSSDDADESAETSAESEEACAPAAGDAIEVVVDEWSIAPATATAGPGTVTFEARNDGEEPHELVIVRAPS
ncbi:MAG TPA: hypothetical protein VFV35_00875, partial [Acidimicrobiales bacterium]|nr:hypothetical protein [Acidimicrobiales bacterium]